MSNSKQKDINFLSSSYSHPKNENKDNLDSQNDAISQFLNSLLDADNLLILAGSGTSLTFNKNNKKVAPSMGDLWDKCATSKEFEDIKKFIRYDDIAPKNADDESIPDIELFLTLCDSHIGLKTLSSRRISILTRFLNCAKALILNETNFTAKVPDKHWKSHQVFIRKLARRTAKQRRLKIFTTNYDLAFEKAASDTGMIVIDGFEFSNPSYFNPAWFNYDIINRTEASNKGSPYLPNVFHLYKVHGSIDWRRSSKGIYKIDSSIISSTNNKENESPVFIYPSSSKYQVSYDSPHLDMMSTFLEAVQKPKTALICIGYGFKDKHLNNAITMALRTNSQIKLLISTLNLFSNNGSFNEILRKQFQEAIEEKKDPRIALMDCNFEQLVESIPDRTISSPEENLLEAMKSLFQENQDVK